MDKSKFQKETLLKRREELLNSTIQYYSVNPSERRNIVYGKNEVGKIYREECKFTPLHPLTEGCALGRFYPKEKQDELDFLDSNEDALKMINNQGVLENLDTEFLYLIQDLHDIGSYWNSTGLSNYGMTQVEYIVKNFIPIEI